MEYGHKTYKKISIHTAGQEEILLMLYRTAIEHTKKAIVAIKQKNISGKAKHIDRVQAIAIELFENLDFELDKRENLGVAKNLAALYDFIIHSCTQASLNLDYRPLEGVLKILTILYSAWAEAIKSLKTNQKN